MTTRKVIITSTNAKLINRFGSQCLVLNVSELTTQTRKSQLHVYTNNASSGIVSTIYSDWPNSNHT